MNWSYEKTTSLGFAAAILVFVVAVVLLVQAEWGHADTQKDIDGHVKLYRELQIADDQVQGAELWHQRYMATGSADDNSSFLVAAARFDEHMPILKESLDDASGVPDAVKMLPDRINS